jgi:hypothetical protein
VKSSTSWKTYGKRELTVEYAQYKPEKCVEKHAKGEDVRGCLIMFDPVFDMKIELSRLLRESLEAKTQPARPPPEIVKSADCGTDYEDMMILNGF